MNIQEAIRQLRRELGITQEELGKLCEKSPITISRWETGSVVPSRTSASKLIEIANKSFVSQSCIEQLNQVFDISRRKVVAATALGYPELDREILCQLVEHGMEAIYVIDFDSHELLYVNQKGERIAGKSFFEAKDKRCFKYILGRGEKCENCPMHKKWSTETNEFILTESNDGKVYSIRESGFIWSGRMLYLEFIEDITAFYNIKKENEILKKKIEQLSIR